MAKWLRAIVALAENQGSVSRTHTAAHSHLVLGDAVLSSGLRRQQSYTWYTYIHTSKILKHIK